MWNAYPLIVPTEQYILRASTLQYRLVNGRLGYDARRNDSSLTSRRKHLKRGVSSNRSKWTGSKLGFPPISKCSVSYSLNNDLAVPTSGDSELLHPALLSLSSSHVRSSEREVIAPCSKTAAVRDAAGVPLSPPRHASFRGLGGHALLASPERRSIRFGSGF